MANSTAFVYRQYQTIDNSGTGAGTQYLHMLWHLYQYLFVDSLAVDAGRWTLLGSSPAAIDWATLSNITDNSWFTFKNGNGRRPWQGKFQATNVAVLDEAPVATFQLVASLSPDGGWVSKGGANGGFSGTTVPAGAHLRLAGLDVSAGSDGVITIHGDRDTLLVASVSDGNTDYDGGCYMGRFEPVVDAIPFPECLLTAWDGTGSPKGFDRSAGGVFGASPSESYALDATTPTPAAATVGVFAPGWITDARQPDPFTNQFHIRPLEIAIPTSPLGFLRHVDATAGLQSKLRMDSRRKLVLHDNALDESVAIKHNGSLSP